jgi:hypothetical protein
MEPKQYLASAFALPIVARNSLPYFLHGSTALLCRLGIARRDWRDLGLCYGACNEVYHN